MHVGLQLSVRHNLSHRNKITTVYLSHTVEHLPEILEKNTQRIYNDKLLKSVKLRKMVRVTKFEVIQFL